MSSKLTIRTDIDVEARLVRRGGEAQFVLIRPNPAR